MAGNDFRKESKIFRASWCLPRQPKPYNTWPAQYFGDLEAASRAQAAGPFFGLVLFAQRNVSKP